LLFLREIKKTIHKRTQKTRDPDLKNLFISFGISKVSANKYRKSPTINNAKVEATIKINPSPIEV